MELDSGHLILGVDRTQMCIVDESSILPDQYSFSGNFFARDTVMEDIGERIGRVSVWRTEEFDTHILIRIEGNTSHRSNLIYIVTK